MPIDTSIPPADLVQLATGPRVRSDFVQSWNGARGRFTVHVHVDPRDRIARLVEMRWRPEPPAADEDLDNSIRHLLRYALGREAEHQAALDLMAAAGTGWAISEDFGQYFPEAKIPEGTLVLDQGVLDEAADRAMDSVRPKPGRPPVSDDEKLHILELYETKGIRETERITDRRERTLRRYIAEAREIRSRNR